MMICSPAEVTRTLHYTSIPCHQGLSRFKITISSNTEEIELRGQKKRRPDMPGIFPGVQLGGIPCCGCCVKHGQVAG